MRTVRAATEAELTALCAQLEYMPSAGLKGITLDVDGTPRVIIGYDGWTEGSVQMHLWILDKKAMGRDIIRAAFRYPMTQCDRPVVLGTVRGDNPEALDFDLRLGFEQIALVPDAYGPGVPMHLLSLHESNCRWL